MLGFAPLASVPLGDDLLGARGTAILGEAADTVIATARLYLVASTSLAETADIAQGTASLILNGSADLLEGADTVVVTSQLRIAASSNLQETGDGAGAFAILPITAVLITSEAADTLSAHLSIPPVATGRNLVWVTTRLPHIVPVTSRAETSVNLREDSVVPAKAA